MTQLFSQLKQYIAQDISVVLAVMVRGPVVGQKALIPAEDQPVGPLLDTAWAASILADGRALLQTGESTVRRYPTDEGGTVEVFFDVHRTAPKLIIVGAVHIAIALIDYAKPLGFCTYVVDPRTAFATPERFAHADFLIPRWPDDALPDIGLTADTCVVVVTHDAKLDDPALQLALASPALYVGALGSPKTHAKRVARLLAEGMPQAQLDRLHAPIGLDIGGRTPAEIALSIMAEIVAVRNRKSIAQR